MPDTGCVCVKWKHVFFCQWTVEALHTLFLFVHRYKLLFKEQPTFSAFRVSFDWSKGETKQDKCQREVEKWAEKKAFPGKTLPNGFLQKIVQVISFLFLSVYFIPCL